MRKTIELTISKKQTNILKGLFAVCVLIHHLYQYTWVISGAVAAIILESLGYLSVSVFLFLSGYGLMVSKMKSGEDYLKSFLRNKVLVFYLQIVLVAILYILLFLAIKMPLSPKEVILSFIFGEGVIVNGWYLYCALYLYLLFFVTFRFFKKPLMQGVCFGIGLCIYYALCRFMGLSHLWYQCVLAFVIGMIYAVLCYRIKTISVSRWILVTCVTFIVFAASIGAILMTAAFSLAGILLKIISSMSFSMLVVLLKPIIAVAFKPLGCLQRISLEIYISQGIFLVAVKQLFPFLLAIMPGEKIVYVYVTCVVLGTILFSILLNIVFGKISGLIKQKKNRIGCL